MEEKKRIEKKIMEIISRSPEQRIRPVELERKLKSEEGFTSTAIKETLNALMEEGKLVFTYRDPCSYVEIPVQEVHHAARPMKVIKDEKGEYWICDADVNPAGDPKAQGCWRCGSLPFTRND